MDEDAIADLFAAFGTVAVRRLFGGAGVYADGLMFAIAVRDVLYLKADKDFAAALERRGSVPFSYMAKGAQRTLNGFWSVPEAALDEAEDLAALARRALGVAREARAGKPPRPNEAARPRRAPARRKQAPE